MQEVKSKTIVKRQGSTYLRRVVAGLLFTAASLMVAQPFEGIRYAQAELVYTWSAEFECTLYGISYEEHESNPEASSTRNGKIFNAITQDDCEYGLLQAERLCVSAASRLTGGYGYFSTSGCHQDNPPVQEPQPTCGHDGAEGAGGNPNETRVCPSEGNASSP
jgi:hypothetical protein